MTILLTNNYTKTETERKLLINSANLEELEQQITIFVHSNNVQALQELLQHMYSSYIYKVQVRSFISKILSNKLNIKDFLQEYKKFGEFGFMDF